MKKYQKITITTLVAVCAVATSAVLAPMALAGETKTKSPPMSSPTQGDDDEGNSRLTAPISMDRAAAIASARTKGYANVAVLEKEDNRLVWDVETVTSKNQVFAVTIDATSGDVLVVDDETNGDEGNGGDDKDGGHNKRLIQAK